MKKILLHYRHDDTTGSVGLVVDGADNEAVNACQAGYMVAHDVIEHRQVSRIGDVFDELEALGAMWYVRGEFNDIHRAWHSCHSPVVHLASDIGVCLQSYVATGAEAVRRHLVTYASVYDDAFCDAIRLAKKAFDAESDAEHDRKVAQAFLACALHDLRNGYRLCKRRYARLTQLEVNALFWNIAEAVDRVLTELEYAGQQVELRYCQRTLRADASIIYDVE